MKHACVSDVRKTDASENVNVNLKGESCNLCLASQLDDWLFDQRADRRYRSNVITVCGSQSVSSHAESIRSLRYEHKIGRYGF